MKAAVTEAFGGVDRLVVREVDEPRPGPGDAVFGEMARPGAHAEYAVVGEDRLLPKPGRLSFEEAAAVPAAGMSALQALRDGARLGAGQRLLVNGAGGGIGTFAVQIAKARGARVTAVASAGKLDLLRQLGADECLDYAREDFARREGAFDAIREAHLRMQSGHARGKIVVRP